ncbi:MAG: hypothetical protein QF618_04780, partial [SAR324 cluster bacterium]|nr:hypothetical protein [SAR324 cluster bacterium]
MSATGSTINTEPDNTQILNFYVDGNKFTQTKIHGISTGMNSKHDITNNGNEGNAIDVVAKTNNMVNRCIRNDLDTDSENETDSKESTRLTFLDLSKAFYMNIPPTEMQVIPKLQNDCDTYSENEYESGIGARLTSLDPSKELHMTNKMHVISELNNNDYIESNNDVIEKYDNS